MGIIQDIHNDLEKGAAQLVAEYRDRLCRDAFAICGDKTEAEDFAFRTFDKVLRKIDTFKGEGSFDCREVRLAMKNRVKSNSRKKGDLIKLAFGVSSIGLETCFWCKLWGCRNLLLVL
jgi:DNA-directed RNA polymerase specialized sigma24 family protein